MQLDYRILLGLLSLAIGTFSYYLYFRGIVRGRVRPDGASWLIWSLLAGIAFFAQFTQGAGAGAWITAFTAVMCLFIAAFSLYRGHFRLQTIDWLSLIAALAVIAVWFYTRDPLLAVILVIVIGAIGFVPTFTKAFYRPKEEAPVTFALNASKFVVAFFALATVDPVTWLYPIAMVLMNTSLSAMIFLRR